MSAYKNLFYKALNISRITYRNEPNIFHFTTFDFSQKTISGCCKIELKISVKQNRSVLPAEYMAT